MIYLLVLLMMISTSYINLFIEIKASLATLFTNDYNYLSSYVRVMFIGSWRLESNDSAIFSDKSAPIFRNTNGKARFYVLYHIKYSSMVMKIMTVPL